jgi:hypothetical protein
VSLERFEGIEELGGIHVKVKMEEELQIMLTGAKAFQAWPAAKRRQSRTGGVLQEPSEGVWF